METISKHLCHGGTLGYYKHAAHSTKCDMRFTMFLPPQAEHGTVPILYFLSGQSLPPFAPDLLLIG